MNLPNVLTLFRLALIPIYIIVFFSDLPDRNVWAFFIVILAGVTDIVDGYIARRYRLTTKAGAMLDPLADKLMILTVFLSLLISGRISMWAGLAIFIRDLGLIIGSAIFHLRGKRTVPANILGKVSTVLYYIAFTCLMFNWPYGQAVLWVTIAFSYLAAFVYISQFRVMNQEPAQH